MYRCFFLSGHDLNPELDPRIRIIQILSEIYPNYPNNPNNMVLSFRIEIDFGYLNI